MKRVHFYKMYIIPAVIICGVVAQFCTRESQVDSKRVAEEKNDEKFNTREAEKDAQFVTDAVAEHLAVLHVADLAIERSRDEEIKRVAMAIKRDLSATLTELTNYSAERAITVPLTETKDARRILDKLQEETTAFDKEWCNKIRELQQESISTLEKGQDKVSDPKLKNWIVTALPAVRKNFDSVTACYNRVR